MISEPGDWPGTLGIVRDGSSVIGKCPRPEKTLIIYEYEASPFCRKVREACSMLDLVVEYRPCPGARYGWSDAMAEITGGRRTVPFLIDPNGSGGGGGGRKAAEGMFESDDIIEYLFETCMYICMHVQYLCMYASLNIDKKICRFRQNHRITFE